MIERRLWSIFTAAAILILCCGALTASTYTYTNGLGFGTDVQGHQWNVWAATGSNVWSWQASYNNGFLHYTFKVLDYSGYYCSGSCRYHNVWSKDPTTGFELADVVANQPGLFPESLQNDHQYQVDVQWSASGYRVSVFDLTSNAPYSDVFYPLTVTSQTFDSWTWSGLWYPDFAYRDETPTQHTEQWTADVYDQGPTGVSGGGGDIRTDALKVMMTQALASYPYTVDSHTRALYHMNEASGSVVADATGVNNGVATSTTGIATGLFGLARSFRGLGQGDYITVPDSPTLRGMSQLTIEAWVYPTAFDLNTWNGTEAVVMKGDNTSPNTFYALLLTRNGGSCCAASSFTSFSLGMDVLVNDIGITLDSPVTHPPDQWYYLVGTYDGSRVRLYVNGLLEIESAPSPSIIVNTTQPLFIDNHTWYNTTAQSYGRIGGLIDEVRISDTARTQAEVSAAAAAGFNGSLASQAALLAKQLVNDPYLLGGKGWDYGSSVFVTPTTILDGYNYYNASVRHTVFGSGVDCSGLVMWSYDRSYDPQAQRELNVVRYENADGQYRSNTTPVDEADLMPGDLLFFDWNSDGRMDHVAMYVGGSSYADVVSAQSPTAGIVLKSKDTLKLLAGFRGFRRVVSAVVGVDVMAHSPVGLTVTDPDGFTITPATQELTDEEILREIPGVLYYSESERSADGTPIKHVFSPVMKTGEYLIKAVPDTGALSTATYSIDLAAGGTVITLARDVPISSVPAEGYGVAVTTDGSIQQFIPVAIDIKPGDSLKSINLGSRGVISVVIFGSSALSVRDVDPASIRFAGAAVALKQNGLAQITYEDINHDGIPDIVAKFNTQDLQLDAASVKAEIVGHLFNGTPFKGWGAVTIVH